MNQELSNIRKDFTLQALNEDSLDDSPIQQFKTWLSEAIESEQPEPTAMTLCTVSSTGIPSARVVLLKNLNESNGFWFYTNYESQKGKELKDNPHAALNFFWPLLERQVRITGTVSKLEEADSDDYFYSRPIESQIGAMASPQSRVIKSREQLENWLMEAQKETIKRPENWGGYALIPYEIEFWQGRASRLHDRIRYKLNGSQWLRERLAP